MADSKISALTAVSAAAGANEFAVNEAGASKKASLTQVETFLGQVVRKNLGSDTATISSTTKVKATNIDQTLGAATWMFEYCVVYQSDTAGTGMSFGVNFSGTQTTFVVEGIQFESTTNASTGAADQVQATQGLRSGGAARAPSTSASIGGSISVDTVNADMMFWIRGLIVVTVSGDLQLYYGSEVGAGGNQLVKGSTSLICRKIV
jgi:hypothetical protein